MKTRQASSLWWDLLGDPGEPRKELSSSTDVDVCIVGGGFTGLWTAYSLKVRDPLIRVCVIESEMCGFGASGRNGGWVSALFSVSNPALQRRYGQDAMHRMRIAMNDAIDHVGRSAEAEHIDCGFHKGGTLVAARNLAQVRRARAEVEESQALGFSPDDFSWLEAREASERMAMDSLLGATFTPHCAVIQPASLVRGLASAVEYLGVEIFEHSPAISIQDGQSGRRPQVLTRGGTITADVVVRATEAWSSQLSESKRAVIPVYSLMVATEPLDDAVWDSIGLRNRETFSEHRNMIIYGQRTADNRFAFGGRGAPYHFGSRIRPSFDQEPAVFKQLHETLRELFPQIGDATITHTWGGPLGIARDWHSSVGLHRDTGIAWAGGYVGDGLSTTNLAGRTLASLIVNDGDDITTLPWVDHHSPAWEPEPLRWLGVNAGLVATRYADQREAKMGRPSKLAGAMAHFLGG